MNIDVHESLERYVLCHTPTPTPTPTQLSFCEEGKDLLILNRFYSTNPSEEQFKLYEGIRSEKLVYEESYTGTATTETLLCVESTIHTLILIDSGGDGWSLGSKLIISSESQELGVFTLFNASSSEILIHPVVGVIDETPISNCSELKNLPSNTTSLIMKSNACNLDSITEFILTNYDTMVLIDIRDGNLMYVNTFVIDGLSELESLKIRMNSFTMEKDSHGNDPSRSFQLLNCPELESIEIGRFSFSDYGGLFELKNLPKLTTINIGVFRVKSWNFYGSSFVINGIIDGDIDNE